MWPLTDGNHCLCGAEADLFRGAVGMMVDQLVLEINEDSETNRELASGDDDGELMRTPYLYRMWAPEQRLWLLERVSSSILATRSPPPASAIFEATIEAIYAEVGDLVALEICEGGAIHETSWRQSLLNAFAARCPQDSLLEALQFEVTALDPCLPPALAEKLRMMGDQQPDDEASNSSLPDQQTESRRRDWFAWWAMIIDRLVDATFGPRLHWTMESMLDGDPQVLRDWLCEKGVNRKFYRRIPPLRSHAQTQASVDRLQSLIFTNE